MSARLEDERALRAAEKAQTAALKELEEKCRAVQKKTFTGWANTRLRKTDVRIEDLYADFHDGLKLIALVESLTGKTPRKYTKNPRVLAQQLENLSLVLTLLEKEGINLVSLDNQHIHQGDPKMTLGLMWALILKYLINKGGSGEVDEDGPRSLLLQWLSEVSGVRMRNFNYVLQDGFVLAKVVNYMGDIKSEPHRIQDPHAMRNADPATEGLKNNNHSMDILQDDFQVEKIVDADIFVPDKPEELSVMTYIALIKERADQLEDEAARNATKSRAFGPGTEYADLGIPAEFTIQAVSSDGADKKAGGDSFRVQVTGIKDVEPTIKDNGDGTYTVNYTCELAGPYLIRVTENGQRIANGPFKIDVTNSAHAGTSYAFGPGIEKVDTFNPAVFTIQAVTVRGVNRTEGGDEFVVKVAGPSGEIPATVVDNDDGTYTVTYKPEEPGAVHVDVTLEEEPIKDSPFDLICLLGADPALCRAYGPGLEGGDTANPAVFTVQSVAPDGTDKKEGGDDFVVSIEGPDGEVPADITDNGDGTYTVSYEPEDVGDYKVCVQLHGKDVQNTPATVKVVDGACPENCRAYGPGLEGGDTAHPAVFTIQAVNPKGEDKKSGGDVFEVTVNGPEEIPAEIEDNGDGTYKVSYEAEAPGDYEVRISLKDKPVAKSPYTVPIKEGTDASKCRAYGPGLEGGNTADPAVFTVQAVSPAGKDRTEGGDPFAVVVTGPSGDVPAEVKDNGDGTYTVSYNPTETGDHQVKVSLEDKPVADKTVPIAEGTSPQNCRAWGPGLEEGDTAKVAEFTVQAVGPDGKDKNFGGDEFAVTVTGPKGEVPAEVTDNKDGTYGVKYSPKDTGDHTVAIQLKNEHVAKSPYTVPVVEGTDPAQTRVFGPGIDGVPSTGRPAVFTIQSVNQAGVDKTKGGDDYKVSVKGAEDLPVEVVDNKDGTCTVTYIPEVAGEYVVDVKLGDDSCGQCPKTVRVKESTDLKTTSITEASITIAAVLATKEKKTQGGDSITATVTVGETTEDAAVTDNGDGTYKIDFDVAQHGEHSVNITINGVTPSWSPLVASF